jgi:hypothetical protein
MEYAPFELEHPNDPRSRSSTWPLPEQAVVADSPERVVIKTERQESESPLPLTPKSEPKKMRNAWGNLSYAELITQAILSTPDKRLTLSEIYDWIVQNVPYFADKANSPSTAGWKVRIVAIPSLFAWLCVYTCLGKSVQSPIFVGVSRRLFAYLTTTVRFPWFPPFSLFFLFYTYIYTFYHHVPP